MKIHLHLEDMHSHCFKLDGSPSISHKFTVKEILFNKYIRVNSLISKGPRLSVWQIFGGIFVLCTITFEGYNPKLVHYIYLDNMSVLKEPNGCNVVLGKHI